MIAARLARLPRALVRDRLRGTPPAARARSPNPRAGRERLRATRNDDGTIPLASPSGRPPVSTSTRERAAGEAAQRRRRPQPFVVAAAGIEPDDEVDAPHPRREQLEIRRQVVAAALLAGLDHADAARVRDALAPASRRSPRATRTPRNRRRRRRGRRACRPRSAGPTARSLAPARHLGLLVEMSVEQAPSDRRRREHRRRAAACDRAGARSRARARAPVGVRTQASARRITRSMCPCASHCGSKCGDFAGIRMYSTSCGTIESFQVREIVLARFVKVVLRARRPGWPRRASGLRDN